MLAMTGLWRVRVLAVVRRVGTAHHLCVVPEQLIVLRVARNVPLSQGLAFFCELLVGQRAQAAERASDGVEDSHAQMLSRRERSGKGSTSGLVPASRTVIDCESWRRPHALSSLRPRRGQSPAHRLSRAASRNDHLIPATVEDKANA